MNPEKRRFFTFAVTQTVSRKSCVESVLLLLLFLIPINFIGGLSVFVILLSVVIVGSYIKSIYGKFDSQKLIRGYDLFLHNGMLGLSLTCTFLMAGVRMLFFLYPIQYHTIILILSFFFVAFVLICYILWVNGLIKKDRYNLKAAQGTISFGAFGILGAGIAKSISKSLSNDDVIRIIAGCFFALVILTLLGTLNLYKYYYIVHSPELIKEIEEILKNEEEDRIRQKNRWMGPTNKRKMDREQKRKHRGDRRSH